MKTPTLKESLNLGSVFSQEVLKPSILGRVQQVCMPLLILPLVGGHSGRYLNTCTMLMEMFKHLLWRMIIPPLRIKA